MNSLLTGHKLRRHLKSTQRLPIRNGRTDPFDEGVPTSVVCYVRLVAVLEWMHARIFIKSTYVAHKCSCQEPYVAKDTSL